MKRFFAVFAAVFFLVRPALAETNPTASLTVRPGERGYDVVVEVSISGLFSAAGFEIWYNGNNFSFASGQPGEVFSENPFFSATASPDATIIYGIIGNFQEL